MTAGILGGHMSLTLEGVRAAGAVAAAALLSGRLPLAPGARVGVVLSGGNIEPELLIEILRGI